VGFSRDQLDRLDELLTKARGEVGQLMRLLESLKATPASGTPPPAERHNPDLDAILGV
jgi:hypothetical protein